MNSGPGRWPRGGPRDGDAPLPPLPDELRSGVAGLTWSQVAWTAAAGALLVALGMSLAGSAVAVAVALVWAALLAGVGLLAERARRRAKGRSGRPRAELVTEVLPPPAPTPQGQAAPTPGAAPAGARALSALQGLPGLHALAVLLAEEAMSRLRAPAAAVLVQHGRRLVAAGSAGDWALARRLQHEATRAETESDPAPLAGPDATDDEPPEFPLDEHLPRLLGLYPRAVPVERWRELRDAPGELLPLVALADRGAGVAVALRHRQRLAGLWVLARRPAGELYSDAELATLEQMARQAAPELARALAEGGEERR